MDVNCQSQAPKNMVFEFHALKSNVNKWVKTCFAFADSTESLQPSYLVWMIFKASLQRPNLMDGILRHKRQFKKRSLNRSSLPYTAALLSIIQLLEFQMVCTLCRFDINLGALDSITILIATEIELGIKIVMGCQSGPATWHSSSGLKNLQTYFVSPGGLLQTNL